MPSLERMSEHEEKLVTMATMIGFSFEIDREADMLHASYPNYSKYRGRGIDYAPVYVADVVWRMVIDVSVYEFLKPWLRAAAKSNPKIALLFEKAKRTARQKRKHSVSMTVV